MRSATGYFDRYQAKLSPLIGSDAAAVVASCYRWTVGFGLCIGAVIPITAFMNPGGWPVGLGLIIFDFVAVCLCGIRCFVLSSRGGKLASVHLAREWGNPVRIAVAKVSLQWWRRQIELERSRVGGGTRR